MSLSQTAFLETSRLPDREALNRSIRALGFDLTVHESYKSFESGGFLPCQLEGRESGFQIFFDAITEEDKGSEEAEGAIEARDCAVRLIWGGEMDACACVLIVSAALARSFGAVVRFDDESQWLSADYLVEEAQRAVKIVNENSSPAESASAPSSDPKRLFASFAPSDAKKLLDLFQKHGIAFEVEADRSELVKPGRTVLLIMGMESGGSNLSVFINESDMSKASALLRQLFPV